jgi:FAD/FMN-containing dehydrogenase
MSTAALTAGPDILSAAPDALLDRAGSAVAAADRILQSAKTGVRTKVAETGGIDAAQHAAHGLSWLALPAGADVAAVRAAVQGRPVVALDGAENVADAWPAPPEGTLAVMARLKERFDPARIFRPGAYVGGI